MDDSQEVESSSLPQVVLDYVAINYQGTSIEESEFSDEHQEYDVYLDNDLSLLFDDGNLIKVYSENGYDDNE